MYTLSLSLALPTLFNHNNNNNRTFDGHNFSIININRTFHRCIEIKENNAIDDIVVILARMSKIMPLMTA